MCLLRTLAMLCQPHMLSMAWDGLSGDAIVMAWVLVVHGLLLVWQLVGVQRSVFRQQQDSCGLAVFWGVQCACALLLILTLLQVLAAVQSRHEVALFTRSSTSPSSQAYQTDGYRVALSHDGSHLRITGTFDHGLTREVLQNFVEHPEIRTIILNSQGGNVFEGRGLSRLIREHGKNTHVVDICASACTTAYIGGRERSAAPHARLGFHQYRFTRAYPMMPTSAEEQQRRDAALFSEAYVDEAFIHRIFSHPPDRMWWPSLDHMRAAGVIHHLR